MNHSIEIEYGQSYCTSKSTKDNERLLRPKGVMVFIEASHFCMMISAVQKQKSTTTTKATIGGFTGDANSRSEALSLMKN